MKDDCGPHESRKSSQKRFKTCIQNFPITGPPRNSSLHFIEIRTRNFRFYFPNVAAVSRSGSFSRRGPGSAAHRCALLCSRSRTHIPFLNKVNAHGIICCNCIKISSSCSSDRIAPALQSPSPSSLSNHPPSSHSSYLLSCMR